MKAFRKIKALSPVISVLLLVIMAAVASVMLYVWFSGYFSTQATKVTGLTELSITVQKTYFTNYDNGYNTTVIIMSIYNPSDEAVNITEVNVTINGIVLSSNNETQLNTTPRTPFNVLPGRTVTVVIRCNTTGIGIVHGDPVDIVIMVSGRGLNTDADYQATYAYSVTAP